MVIDQQILTDSQQEIADAIINTKAFRTTLAGLAGSGKSFLAKYIYDSWTAMGLKTCVLGPTGKSACVLRAKGVPATTLHRAIYRYCGNREDHKGEIEPVFKDNGKRKFCDRLIIDEASMLTPRHVRDIEDRGIQVLYVGDPGQLPPVKAADNGLFNKPTHILREIHRQAAGNPIIQFAHLVRKGAPLTHRHPGINYIEVRGRGAMFVADQMIEHGIDRLIVASNAQRVALNTAYRDITGRRGVVAEGDEIICTMNNPRLDVVNGEIFRVLGAGAPDVMSTHVELESIDTGQTMHCRVWNAQFGQEKKIPDEIDQCYMLADHAYSATCHRFQGSSAPHIGVSARGYSEDGRRWNYTAVTRAEKDLTIFY